MIIDALSRESEFELLASTAGSYNRRALGMRPRWKRPAVKAEPVEELRKQANIAVKVLKVFRGAALLLDEVRRRFPRGSRRECRPHSPMHHALFDSSRRVVAALLKQ